MLADDRQAWNGFIPLEDQAAVKEFKSPMIIRKLAYTLLALVIALSCGTATVHSASQWQARIGSGQYGCL